MSVCFSVGGDLTAPEFQPCPWMLSCPPVPRPPLPLPPGLFRLLGLLSHFGSGGGTASQQGMPLAFTGVETLGRMTVISDVT